MNPSIGEFLEFLDKEDDTDYGDFKREVDLHLVHMAEALRPLSAEQRLQIQRMREQLLWSYKFDIEEMRSLLRYEVQHLEGAPEL
ncbi:hypothetical protein [Bdellovibrio sp.]|uniref:hypothetical protein n=1 Tax=Bdellovibrio TaxID=958 RepID=UPI0032214718